MSYYIRKRPEFKPAEPTDAALDKQTIAVLSEALSGMLMLWRGTCGLYGWDADAYAETNKAQAALDLVKLRSVLDQPTTASNDLRIGARVEVLNTAGFHRGAKGIVTAIGKDGLVWVLRDGSTSSVYFHPKELRLI